MKLDYIAKKLNNSILARFFTIVCFVVCEVFLLSAAVGIERNEADLFLQALPESLQERQTEAVRAAIDGDNSLLEAVRNSRNKPAALPEGVIRRNIDSTLTLFRSARYDNDTLPLLVYFHGGGWVLGSINSCSAYCGAMAERGIAVLAVNYRLAPENRFPAGLDDCIAAVKLAADSLSAWKCRSISLGGDSSGGNLAITTAMSFPSETFSSLIAFYPVTKAYADDSESWRCFGLGFGLDGALMEAFNDAYTSNPHNPFVSPAEASDFQIMKLPPTLVVAAERDILRCQGAEFSRRLSGVGVECKYVMIPGSVHLFITVAGQPAAFYRSVDESSEFILAR